MDKKQSTGRPRKTVKRVKPVCVKYTREEHFMIAALARSCNIKLSVLVRLLSLQREPKIVTISGEDRKLMLNLIRFSGNLNVLAKNSYHQHLFELAESITILKDQINQILNKNQNL